MARKRAPRATKKPGADAGGLALIASILGNLALYRTNTDLKDTVSALERVVSDWHVAYQQLDTQLQHALRTIDLQNELLASLRSQLRDAQARAYQADERALAAEAARRKAKGA